MQPTYTLAPPTSDAFFWQVTQLPTSATASAGISDFLVVWNSGWGVVNTAPSVLQLNSITGVISDVTTSSFGGAPAPIANPRNLTMFPDGTGGTYVLFANQGLDKSPWPGATDTLYDWKNGTFTVASGLLPSSLAYSHDVTSGPVNSAGNVGIFVNNVYSQPNTAPYYLLEGSPGQLSNVSSTELPTVLHTTSPSFTSSLLAPLTASGLSSLVIGSANLLQNPSEIFLNPGDGNFANATPIPLPASPLTPTAGLYDSNVTGPSVLDIQPIHISSSTYDDLVVVSTTGDYQGFAVQILINDGTGHFIDQTAARLTGAPSFNQPQTTPESPGSGIWMIRSFVADVNGDGAPDIALEGTNGAPSEIFLNNGAGVFSLAYTAPANQAIVGTANVGGAEYILEGSGSTVTLLPTSDAYLSSNSSTLSSTLATQLHLYGNVSSGQQATTRSATYDTTITITLHGAYTPGSAQNVDLKVNGTDLGSQSLQSAYGFTYQGQQFSPDQTLTFTMKGLQTISDMRVLEATQGAGIFLTDVKINEVDLGAVNNWAGVTDAINAAQWNSAVNAGIGSSQNPIHVTGDGHVDTAYVLGSIAQYSWSGNGGAVTLTESSGLNQNAQMINVSQIKFSDYTLVLDMQSSQDLLVYKLYQAAFARTPDNSGFRYWAQQADANNLRALSLAGSFLSAPEFTQKYGSSPSDAAYVTALYTNVLGRSPDQSGLNYWIGKADAGEGRDQLLVAFATSAENAALVGSHTSNGFWTT